MALSVHQKRLERAMRPGLEGSLRSFHLRTGSRARVLETAAASIRYEEVGETEYILPETSDAAHHQAEFRYNGDDGASMFQYASTGRDKAWLRLHVLSRFSFHRAPFESVIAFADQRKRPRLDQAKLSNFAGPATALIEVEDELRPKIERVAA